MKTANRYLVVAACIVASSAHAEEPKNQQQFDDVIVSATRGEKSIADAPGSISIVTADEISKRNIRSVDQAFTLLPGVLVNNQKGPMSTSTTVTMRGLPGQNRTLILLDGIPLNDAYTSAVAYSGLYAEDLQKIEVVRGPSSSLYGGAAMGGVVNMISAMPRKREITLSGGYGDAHPKSEGVGNLWTTHASYGDKIGKLRLFTALGYKSVDGFPTNQVVTSSAPTAGLTGWSPTTDSKGAKRYLIGDTGNSGVWDYNAAFRAQYDFSDSSNLRFSYLRNSFRTRYVEPHTYLKNAAGTPVYTYGSVNESNYLSGDYFQAHDTYSLSGETLIGNVKGKITLGMKDIESWYLTPTTGATGAKLAGGPGKRSFTPNTAYFADAQVSVPVLDKHLLTAGVSYRYDTSDVKDLSVTNWKDENTTLGDRNSWAGGTNSVYAAFLQAEVALLDNLTLYAGVRDDYWVTSGGYAGQTGAGSFDSKYPERSQNSISPKGAVVWKPLEGTTVRVSGGKAFRAPTISNLYRLTVSVSGGVTTTTGRNPDLKPETVRIGICFFGTDCIAPEIRLRNGFFGRFSRISGAIRGDS
ncbi:MAG TPA: TonB-dependent receptor, partial [Desulfuromonadales bacterium]|nr:TonB-dependent receptor [Desulfuromonadales bacterium]